MLFNTDNIATRLTVMNGKTKQDVPVVRLSAATTFPRQNYWTDIPHNVHGEDVPFLSFMPVHEGEIDYDQLWQRYDAPSFAVKDSQDVERNEDLVFSTLARSGVTRLQMGKILASIESFDAGGMESSALFRRALVENIKDFSSKEYHSLVSIISPTQECGDSLVRLLRL